MRKVKSTHNFGQLWPPPSSPFLSNTCNNRGLSSAVPDYALLRASPSMPTFPTDTRLTGSDSRDQSHSHDHGTTLPDINEEQEEGGLRPLPSMILDDPDPGGDDFLHLMKELNDPENLDLDISLGGGSRVSAGVQQEAAGSGNGGGGAVAAGGAVPYGGSAMLADAAPPSPLLDGLPTFYDEELNSAFLGNT
jgi:hypothetical protein